MTDALFPAASPTPPGEAADLGKPCLTFTVPGDPVGQGRISYGRHGHGYHTNAKTLKPWRAKVTACAEAVTGQHAYAPPAALTRAQKNAGVPRPPQICQTCRTPRNRHGLIHGPVALLVVVTFARPKSAPTRAYPTGANIGDWDHHGRSVSDALTGVLWPDDKQIVDGRVIKTYPGGHPESRTTPGAVIRVWTVSP